MQCFADASGRDFKQFMRWYSQAGTPEVAATGRYDAAAKTYRLDVAQTTRPTPGQPVKEPQVVPLGDRPRRQNRRPAAQRSPKAQRLSAAFWCSTSRRKASRSRASRKPPVLSINRGFSAPIKLDAKLTSDDLRALAARDSDPFNRWQAVQTLATELAHRQCRTAARRS